LINRIDSRPANEIQRKEQSMKDQQTVTKSIEPSFQLDIEELRSELAQARGALAERNRELQSAQVEIMDLRELEGERDNRIKELELQLTEKQLPPDEAGCQGLRKELLLKEPVTGPEKSTAGANRTATFKRRWQTRWASKRRWKLSP
jgi:hypothetical protein